MCFQRETHCHLGCSLVVTFRKHFILKNLYLKFGFELFQLFDTVSLSRFSIGSWPAMSATDRFRC